MTRELNLSKYAAQLLASRLKHNNFNFSLHRQREKEFRIFFTKEESLVYCHDVNGLIRLVGIKYFSKDWRLFIDS